MVTIQPEWRTMHMNALAVEKNCFAQQILTVEIIMNINSKYLPSKIAMLMIYANAAYYFSLHTHTHIYMYNILVYMFMRQGTKKKCV